MKLRLDEIRAEDQNAIVVYDVPLLAEAGDSSAHRWDLVVIAEAPAEVRIERMVSLRGMSREEAEQRISNQASDEARRAIADVIIDTGGTEAHTLDQVDRLWARLGQRSSDSEHP